MKIIELKDQTSRMNVIRDAEGEDFGRARKRDLRKRKTKKKCLKAQATEDVFKVDGKALIP